MVSGRFVICAVFFSVGQCGSITAANDASKLFVAILEIRIAELILNQLRSAARLTEKKIIENRIEAMRGCLNVVQRVVSFEVTISVKRRAIF